MTAHTNPSAYEDMRAAWDARDAAATSARPAVLATPEWDAADAARVAGKAQARAARAAASVPPTRPELPAWLAEAAGAEQYPHFPHMLATMRVARDGLVAEAWLNNEDGDKYIEVRVRRAEAELYATGPELSLDKNYVPREDAGYSPRELVTSRLREDKAQAFAPLLDELIAACDAACFWAAVRDFLQARELTRSVGYRADPAHPGCHCAEVTQVPGPNGRYDPAGPRPHWGCASDDASVTSCRVPAARLGAYQYAPGTPERAIAVALAWAVGENTSADELRAAVEAACAPRTA